LCLILRNEIFALSSMGQGNSGEFVGTPGVVRCLIGE